MPNEKTLLIFFTCRKAPKPGVVSGIAAAIPGSSTPTSTTQLYPAILDYRNFISTEQPDKQDCFEYILRDLLSPLDEDEEVQGFLLDAMATESGCTEVVLSAIDDLPAGGGNRALRGRRLGHPLALVAVVVLALLTVLVTECPPDSDCVIVGWVGNFVNFMVEVSNEIQNFLDNL